MIQIGGVYTTFCQEGGIFLQKYAIEMGGVSRYSSKVSGSGVDLTLLSFGATFFTTESILGQQTSECFIVSRGLFLGQHPVYLLGVPPWVTPHQIAQSFATNATNPCESDILPPHNAPYSAHFWLSIFLAFPFSKDPAVLKYYDVVIYYRRSILHYLWRDFSCGYFPQVNKVFQRPCGSVLHYLRWAKSPIANR